MASIPLPALDLKPPQQPDVMGDVSKLLALRSMMGQQQLQQQELQIRAQQVKDQQATTSAMRDWDGKDYDVLAKSVLDHGGSATAAQGVQQHGLAIKKAVSDIAAQDATTGSKKLETFIGQHKAIGDELETLVDPSIVPDDQLHAKSAEVVSKLSNAGIMDAPTAQQAMQAIQNTQDPKALRALIDQTAKSSLGMKTIAEQQKVVAETRSDNANAAMKEIEAAGLKGLTPELVSKQVDNVFDPQNPQTAGQNRLLKSVVLGKLTQGDLPGAKQALQDGFQSALGIQKDIAEKTNPAIQAAELHLATAKKAAEQAITDGDPRAAAQLLIDGTVAPSQLVSSRKPAFAQQAFTAAAAMQPGWSATKADADYKVASSPTNVAFFGSAKSLTDKGGTLDQLADAAKDIPDGQIPVFNSIADAMRAATGSGPIAKYASILLGVADDYSKVMGGGQGSDTSRTQALSLAPAKGSPEARAAAIEGIRGAVNSQIKSRIGNNPVLQKMYGGDLADHKNDFFSQFGGQAK
jgi:hypothetical protein